MTAEQMGVGHSSDVYLLFNSAKVGLNATDKLVGRTMIDFWHSFASTGVPTSGAAAVATIDISGSEAIHASVMGSARSAAPAWPEYNPANSSMLLDINSSVATNIHTSRCAFWSGLHPVPYRS